MLNFQDSEKINKLVDGKQEEAFNEKKNLNLDYITNKFNIRNEAEEPEKSIAKPTISKKFLLTKIDEILSNDKNPLPPKNAQHIIALGEKIKVMLENKSKKIFKISTRKNFKENSISDSPSPIQTKKITSNPTTITSNLPNSSNPFGVNIPAHLQGFMDNNPYLNLDMYSSNSQLSMQIAKMNAHLNSMQQAADQNIGEKKSTEQAEKNGTNGTHPTDSKENGNDKNGSTQSSNQQNNTNFLIHNLNNPFFQNFFNQSFLNQPGVQNSLLNMTQNQGNVNNPKTDQ